jgi:hypothetical protein
MGAGLASFAYFGMLAHGPAPEPIGQQGGGGSIKEKVKEVKDKATSKH